MAKEQSAIDISHVPELERLAEEVRETGTPRMLRRGNEVIARIVPVAPLRANLPARHRARAKTQADMEAFLSAAGSWKGLVDGEQLKKDIKEARGSNRSFPAL